MDSTIKTYTGRKLDLARPDPEVVCVEDVAHALSMICRYGGHPRGFYSVAEHSVNVEELAGSSCSSSVRFALLMHDASEAYLGDVIAPLKILLPEYRRLEAEWSRVIFEKFGIPHDEHTSRFVHEADVKMRKIEQLALFVPDEVDAAQVHHLELIRCFRPEAAKLRFLGRFYRLLVACGRSG